MAPNFSFQNPTFLAELHRSNSSSAQLDEQTVPKMEPKSSLQTQQHTLQNTGKASTKTKVERRPTETLLQTLTAFPAGGPWSRSKPPMYKCATPTRKHRPKQVSRRNSNGKRDLECAFEEVFIEFLDRDIRDFVRATEIRNERGALRRRNVIEFYTTLITAYFNDSRIKASVFGSSATGLHLQDSDIDIVIIGSDSVLEQTNIPSKLSKLSKRLRPYSTDLIVLRKTKIPLIKLRDRNTYLELDISFQSANGTTDAVLITLELMREIPNLKPLVFVLKRFLSARNLNSGSVNALSGYATVLLLAGFIRLHPSLFPPSKGLGQILLDFFQFFGTMFDYSVYGIAPAGLPHARSEYLYLKAEYGFFDARASNLLSVMDPLNPLNDVSRCCGRISEVSSEFASAYKTLLDEPEWLLVREGYEYEEMPTFENLTIFQLKAHFADYKEKDNELFARVNDSLNILSFFLNLIETPATGANPDVLVDAFSTVAISDPDTQSRLESVTPSKLRNFDDLICSSCEEGGATITKSTVDSPFKPVCSICREKRKSRNDKSKDTKRLILINEKKDRLHTLSQTNQDVPKNWTETEVDQEASSVLSAEPFASLLETEGSGCFYIHFARSDRENKERTAFLTRRGNSRPILSKSDGSTITPAELELSGFLYFTIREGKNPTRYAELERVLHERTLILPLGRRLHRKCGGANWTESTDDQTFGVYVTYHPEGIPAQFVLNL